MVKIFPPYTLWLNLVTLKIFGSVRVISSIFLGELITTLPTTILSSLELKSSTKLWLFKIHWPFRFLENQRVNSFSVIGGRDRWSVVTILVLYSIMYISFPEKCLHSLVVANLLGQLKLSSNVWRSFIQSHLFISLQLWQSGN